MTSWWRESMENAFFDGVEAEQSSFWPATISN